MPSDNSCTIASVGKLIDRRYTLTSYCYAQDCRHSSQLDLEALARRLGRDHTFFSAICIAATIIFWL